MDSNNSVYHEELKKLNITYTEKFCNAVEESKDKLKKLLMDYYGAEMFDKYIEYSNLLSEYKMFTAKITENKNKEELKAELDKLNEVINNFGSSSAQVAVQVKNCMENLGIDKPEDILRIKKLKARISELKAIFSSNGAAADEIKKQEAEIFKTLKVKILAVLLEYNLCLKTLNKLFKVPNGKSKLPFDNKLNNLNILNFDSKIFMSYAKSDFDCNETDAAISLGFDGISENESNIPIINDDDSLN